MQWTAIYVFCDPTLADSWKFILAVRLHDCLQIQSKPVTLAAMYRPCCSVDILDRQALGISNIIRKLIQFFPPPLLVNMPTDLLQSFFEQLTQLTCRFSEGAAQEELVGTFE
jgi:hypothetical protein